MAVAVKSITLWRRELEHRPGALAESLAPLPEGGVDVQILMAYRIPGDPQRGAVELYPITGRRQSAAAERAGFSASSIPAVLVEGDDAAGLAARMTRSLADAGINLDFVVGQVIGRKYSAVFGFESQDGARRAISLIKQAAGARRSRKTPTRRVARR